MAQVFNVLHDPVNEAMCNQQRVLCLPPLPKDSALQTLARHQLSARVHSRSIVLAYTYPAVRDTSAAGAAHIDRSPK